MSARVREGIRMRRNQQKIIGEKLPIDLDGYLLATRKKEEEKTNQDDAKSNKQPHENA